MKLRNLLEPLIAAHLADNHHADIVRFTDELLMTARELGGLSCVLTGAAKWHFEAPEEEAWELELGRAKTKIRMLCAHLSVRCNQSGAQDVSVYGGEGLIRLASQHTAGVGAQADGKLRAEVTVNRAVPSAQTCVRDEEIKWTVRFKNTMHEQRFSIIPE